MIRKAFMKVHRNQPTPSNLKRYKNSEIISRVVNNISFPRPAGSRENALAREIVCEEFDKIGFPVVDNPELNIVFGDPKKAKILVGAHYDSVPKTPGADDNASAVAVMLYIASNTARDDDVCFVAFNSEEDDLKGSKAFVENLGESNLEEVHILEMVGYRSFEPDSQQNPLSGLIKDLPTVGDFIGVVANEYLLTKIMGNVNQVSIPVVGLAVPELMLYQLDQFAPHLTRSDHAPFWYAGIHAAMWTDTAEFRNKNYHQPTDTPDTLDYDFMEEVGNVILDVINENKN